MAFTLQDAEEMYTKAMHDADKGDSSAQLFVKHCDPFDFVDNNDGKTDDDGKADDDGDNAELPQTGAKALYEAFKTTGNMKAALREMTGVVSDENQRMTAFLARFKLDEDFTLKTEELGLSFVPMKELKGAYTHLSIRNGELGLWNDTKFADIRYYDDEKELAKVLKGLIKPIVPKVVDNGKADDDVDFYGQEGTGLNIIEIYNARKASPIDYAEMHREEKALLKVKQRGRKKQREKNRRLRENRDKELREKNRLLRKKEAEKNAKKKQSKRERKRFSPMSKDMRMLDESIKDGFALK